MRFLFLLLDFIVFFITTAFIITIRSISGSWNFLFFLNNCKVMVPIFILNVILLLIFSFYDLKKYNKIIKNDFIELSLSFIIAFVLSAAGIYFGVHIFNIPTPKTNLLLILLIFYTYVFLSRKVYDSLHFLQINIITLGTSSTLNKIKEKLKNIAEYKIVSELNSIEEMPQNLNATDVDFILVSNDILEQEKDTAKLILTKFVANGSICLTDLMFFEYIFSRLPEETLRNTNQLIKEISVKQKDFIYDVIKRLFDIFVSICLIPIFLPIGLIIYFLILIIDRQKPIFFQERVGFKGKAIQICKFRTLITETETPTRLGKVLRKFRLDEIPQLINILDGNISIVGPRPLWMKEYLFLNNYIFSNSLRTLAKPGLTGWAQLNFKAPPVYVVLDTPNFENNNKKDEYFKDAFVRLAYDVWYVKNASVMLDIEIMLKTAKRMFVKDNTLTN